MTKDSEQRLCDWVQDPEGAYTVLRRGAHERLERKVQQVLCSKPTDPVAAFATLCSLHELWLETQALTDPERFVELFAPQGVE